ncbi:MAG: A24 family peptidase [Sphingomonadales bacterium]|jgi:prepilin signal peptidase PulO-like enzyme (type II secretory pathway)
MKLKITYFDVLWMLLLWALMMASWWFVHGQGALIWTLMLSAALAFLIIYDFRHFLLPNIVTIPLLILGLVFRALQSIDAFITSLIGVMLGIMLLVLISLGYRKLRGREGLGFGDAKLVGAAGAWLGWAPLSLVLLLGSLTALNFVAAKALISAEKIDAHHQVAFGSYLAFGFWLCWLLPI